MAALGRNHKWRELFVAERALSSLSIMNRLKPNDSSHQQSSIIDNQSSNHLSTEDDKTSSHKNNLMAPVVLNRYHSFKMSSDSIRSRTLKVKSKERDNSQLNMDTPRRQKIKYLKELINQHSVKGRNKTKDESSRNKSRSNPEDRTPGKLINSRFIIKTKSNILSRFERKEDRFMMSINESRIESKKEDNKKDRFDASSRGWARIIKCLDMD